MAGVAGIEPASVVLETIILPLYYTPISTALISYHISPKLSTKKYAYPRNLRFTSVASTRSIVPPESASDDDYQNTVPVPGRYDSNDPQWHNALNVLPESVFLLVHDNDNTYDHPPF